MTRDAKLREIESLLSRVRQLETELAADLAGGTYPPKYYFTYQVLIGCIFGVFGAAVSLLFNVIGSLIIHQHPLQLIRVYLTFPLGEQALLVTDDHVTLAIGCCLYLATGMLLGVPMQLVISRYFSRDRFSTRLWAVIGLSLGLWLINFYGILSWLQPLLFGGNWIVEKIPWWVAAATHVVFGVTVLLAQPLGTITPYRRSSEAK